jgi:hypothetical protein
MFLPFENPAKNILHFFFVGFVKGKTRKRILSFRKPGKAEKKKYSSLLRNII